MVCYAENAPDVPPLLHTVLTVLFRENTQTMLLILHKHHVSSRISCFTYSFTFVSFFPHQAFWVIFPSKYNPKPPVWITLEFLHEHHNNQRQQLMFSLPGHLRISVSQVRNTPTGITSQPGSLQSFCITLCISFQPIITAFQTDLHLVKSVSTF